MPMGMSNARLVVKTSLPPSPSLQLRQDTSPLRIGPIMIQTLGVFALALLGASNINGVWAGIGGDGPKQPPALYKADRADNDVYIVSLRSYVTKEKYLQQLWNQWGHGVKIVYEYEDTFLHGFALQATDVAVLEALREDEQLEYIAQDAPVDLSGRQVDDVTRSQARLSSLEDHLQEPYTFECSDSAGQGVDIYMLDTGVNFEHREFAVSPTNMQPRISCGFSVGKNGPCDDTNGHGTLTASLAAGLVFGIAKAANIISVKVTHENGKTHISDLLAGLNFVHGHTKIRGAPSVVLLPYNVQPNRKLRPKYGYQTLNFMWPLDSALEMLIRYSDVFVVASAGNDGKEASIIGPTSKNVIKVGALDSDDDVPAEWSNKGSGITFWAPGEDITGAWVGDDNVAVGGMYGTSYAAASVTGLATYISDYGKLENDELIVKMQQNAYKANGLLIPQMPIQP